MKNVALLMFTILCSCSFNQTLKVEADLIHIKDTGYPAIWMCYDSDENDCGVWGTFHLYTAKVRRVVSGKVLMNEFKVIYGRHALGDSNLITLKKLERGNDYDAEFQVEELIPKQVVLQCCHMGLPVRRLFGGENFGCTPVPYSDVITP